MSFLYIIGLGLVALVTFAIGQGTNAAANVAAVVFFLAAIALYFSPAAVAHSRKHKNRVAVTVLNVLLGWTLLGWVASLVWAYTDNTEQQVTA